MSVYFPMANEVYSLLISAFLVIFSSTLTDQSKEILIDEERPIIEVDKHEEYSQENIEESLEHSPCHMEYQVC